MDISNAIHLLLSKGRKVYYVNVVKKGKDKGLGNIKFWGRSEYVTQRIEEAEAGESGSTFNRHAV